MFDVMTAPSGNDRAAPFATDAARWAALRRRDPAADGHFLFSVETTGVYCRPSCAARSARPEHVAFHADCAAAERAGFRACKRCRPDQPSRAEREAALVADACRLLEGSDEPPGVEALAARAGVSPPHFHRLFRRITGVTPKAYATAQRQRRVTASLRREAGVTEAIYAAGYGSPGRFYEEAPELLGMTPTAYRRGGRGEALEYATARCSLGRLLVATTARGVCAILLGDRVAELEAELARRFPAATRSPGGPRLLALVAEVVRLVDDPGRAGDLSLPLDIRGTAFQRRVWEQLRRIPVGQTRSYGEVAAELGQPRAARAVAAACAANPLAVAVPCHRVAGGDGKLRGYRWGVARKQRLLDKERG
jgi:AraC family transcriptional regulator of adaptative response/methylated-DNA-[protein]-cysteine methyltransferase